jgi:hypothetical protein
VADQSEIEVRDSGQSGFPVGTRAEVIAKHMDPKTVPTCSQPVDGVNVGCPFYSSKRARCVFHTVRNAEAGPENFGYYKKLPTGVEQGFMMPCYLFMDGEFALWQQRHVTGVRWSRFYQVGEEITRLVRVPKHPTVDPDCHRCRTGSCNLSKTVKITETIKAFPRPDEGETSDIFPFEDASEDSGIDLELASERQPKVGTQVEEIMRKRREQRKITERASGEV